MQALSRTDDGYRNAKTIAQDAICRGGHELQVVWVRDHYEAACVTAGCTARGILPRHELEQQRIRERLERNPQLATTLAVQGASVAMTTAALKGLSDEQMGARVEQAFATVLKSSPHLRGQIVGMAQMYGLDPLFDLIVYQNTPYPTYPGWMRKRREHPHFRGEVELRPLTKDEKRDWGFDERDIVVKNTLDMGPQGLVTDFGVVHAVGETSPVAKQHPQLLAIKRARVRVARIATGLDLPAVIDVDESGRVVDILPVEQPAMPADGEERGRRRFWGIAHGAPPDGLGLDDARVHALLGVESVSDYQGGWDAALRDLTERAAEAESETWPPVTMASAIGQRYAELLEEAAALELDVEDLKVSFPAAYEDVVRKGEKLRDRIDDVHRLGATEA